MGEEVEFIYYMRFSSGNVYFHTRLVLADELEHERSGCI